MDMHYVYIIYSASQDVYYKGYTLNVEKRLAEHNLNLSRYTANKGPWVLIHVEAFSTKTEALKREKALKKCKKEYFLWLSKQPKI